jgi:hypothetical protein
MWARIRPQFINLPAARKPSAVYDGPYAQATSLGASRAARVDEPGELTPLCDGAARYGGV